MKTEIILALDLPTDRKAFELIQNIDASQCRLKVGKEMFTRYGPAFVEELQKQGFEVFLDLKFHDIPNTVASACKVASELGVWMVNVHALGGQKMMSDAREAIGHSASKTLLTAVTVLTSHDEQTLKAIGVDGDIELAVLRLALLAERSGVDGVVCSSQEVKKLKSKLKQSFLYVTPGIRPQWANKNDQSRVMTPAEAQDVGVNYIVVGRPVTRSQDPYQALEKIKQELEVKTHQ